MNVLLALVVGISTYDNHTLETSANDAEDVANTLKELGFKVIKHIDVTYDQFIEALTKFGAELDDNDIALFYFAGHGFQIEGENFLTGTNTT